MKIITQTLVKTRHALSIIVMATIMLAGYSLTAQVAVTNDGSSADGSAMLDVKSTDKGFLPPRMTQVQIEAIASPANGLTVFNTTDGKLYIFVAADNEWKEVLYGSGTITPPPPVAGDFYEGGVVFYIFQSGDPGYVAGETHGLICAVSDQGGEWGCRGTVISGADGTAIGTGEQNTIDIEAGCTTSGTAADICANLSLNGYNDWFLPSKDELNQMYQNKATIDATAVANGGSSFDSGTTSAYWSSTENNNNNAWLQSFYDGGQYDLSKSFFDYVRAVRAF